MLMETHARTVDLVHVLYLVVADHVSSFRAWIANAGG